MSDPNLRERGRRPRPEPHDLDRVRDFTEGVLSADEREAVLAKARGDRELGEFLEAFGELEAVLGAPTPDASACGVTFDDLEWRMPASGGGDRSRERWGRRGRWAAAAILLVSLGILAVRAPSPEAVPTVRLLAIAAPSEGEAADPGAQAALACADLLADHAPLRDGEVGWIPSLRLGRAAARVTGRPLLLFIHHPVCPICDELEAGPLRDPGVRERIARFVPVGVLASFEDPDPDLDRDWPYFAVLSAEGIVLGELAVPASTAEFVAFLDDQTSRHLPAAAPAWDHVRELAWRLREAVRLDRGHDLRRSEPLLEALAADPDALAFASAARSLLMRRARDAYERLRDAAVGHAMREDRASTLRRLDEAVAETAGTPYERDFAAVREAFHRSGSFPRLDPMPLPRR